MASNPEKTQFGERTVTANEKTQLVRGVFDSVAERYDLMNDLMSGGVHRLWKDALVRMIRPKPGQSFLDVAGGTGDIAFRIKKKLGSAAHASDITLLDLNHAMLSVGRDRALDEGRGTDFNWVTGNAEFLPCDDHSFDVYTIAFGLRNVTYIDDALKEAHRVLKPGGRFFCLEFSRVHVPIFNKMYDLYLDTALPVLGEKVANDRESYQYLAESIRKFPAQTQLKRRVEAVGFKKSDFRNLSGGIAAIHTGVKA